MTSYFHMGREIHEPLESRVQDNLIALRNRTGGNDEPNGDMVEADGFITVVPKLQAPLKTHPWPDWEYLKASVREKFRLENNQG